ncbi:hypothetical protein [Caenimonas aquaedulcis]|uniref:STAS/SEC14 domain-containing protein n=1 Tax=Caenimonas aquaedulcis TaxID=2793270 RepID=A0A931H4U4_9BURK|nr:hypothetical protein [Caenimonas aquaedulcis]MBG9388656.1 hypothetical protein [Caenimonas aquaedulcis]
MQFTLHVRIERLDGYVLGHLSGLVSVEAWDKALRELGAGVAGMPGDRLVVDLTGLVGWLGIPERTEVGKLWAIHLSRMEKVALFIQPEKIAGVVEAQARREGLNLRVVSSYEEAVDWVTS